MHKLRTGVLALLLIGAAVGCSTQTSPGNILTGQVFLQLAVGTLNDSAGTITGAAGTYLNAVSSFRNNLGASAFAAPGNGALHVPGAPAIVLGPAPCNGLYSYGQGPGCNGVVGMPPAYVPASTVGGYATGFIVTGAPPTSGAYALTTIATVNGQNQQYGASATLPASPKVLGAIGAPTYASGGATGGGTFTVAPPAGVTETLIVVFSGTNEVASAMTHGTTAALPPGTLAPGAYTAFAIGADYPLVESGPPASAATQPTIVGAGGTADLTASASAGIVQ